MKKFFVIFICIACLAVIVFGKLYWNHKLDTTATESRESVHSEDQKPKQEPETEAAERSMDSEEELEQLTSRLPDDSAKMIKQAVQQNETINIVAMGSDATDTGEDGWPQLFEQQLNEAYGNDIFSVSTKNFGDELSIDVWRNGEYEEIYDMEPDIIVFEPFILNDNGEVNREDTMDALGLMLKQIQEELPDAHVFLQPPNPVYQPNYYLDQLDSLQTFAEENGIPYLNHWENWPDPDSGNIHKYLQDNETLPNKKGNEAWAQYLSDYFSGQ